MRKSSTLLISLLPSLACGESSVRAADYSVPALQADYYQPPSWAPTVGIVGTLSPTWTNNAFFSRDNRASDWYFNADISLRLDGRLTQDLSYRLYVRSDSEIFAREKDANISMALWGARLNKDIAGWRLSVIYENRYPFDGFYRDNINTISDVKLALSNSFRIGTVIFSPFLQGRYRFSDLAEAEYYRLDAALGIEAPLNERWSIVSSPFFEAYKFTGGLNSGRSDQIYSASLGLKYNILSNISLTTSAAYEERFSNVAIRHYQSWDIGTKLDLAF